MKLLTTLCAGAALALALPGFSADQSLTSQKQRASYGIGMNVGNRFKNDVIELDVDAFMKGFKDALAGTKPALSDAELKDAMDNLRKDVESKVSEQGGKNKKEGEDFLAKNKTQKGVQIGRAHV